MTDMSLFVAIIIIVISLYLRPFIMSIIVQNEINSSSVLLIDKPRTVVPVRIKKVHPITGCTFFSYGYATTLSLLFSSDPSCRVDVHIFNRELNALDNYELAYFHDITTDVHTVAIVFSSGPFYRYLKNVYKSYLYRQPERRNKKTLRSFLYAEVSLSSI